jgi:hypothetical protein
MKPIRNPGPTGDPLRMAVAVAIKACEMKGIVARDAQRRRVLDYAKSALEGELGPGDVKTTIVDGEELVYGTATAVFRYAFSLADADRHDLHQQEVLFARIEALLNATR